MTREFFYIILRRIYFFCDNNLVNQIAVMQCEEMSLIFHFIMKTSSLSYHRNHEIILCQCIETVIALIHNHRDNIVQLGKIGFIEYFQSLIETFLSHFPALPEPDDTLDPQQKSFPIASSVRGSQTRTSRSEPVSFDGVTTSSSFLIHELILQALEHFLLIPENKAIFQSFGKYGLLLEYLRQAMDFSVALAARQAPSPPTTTANTITTGFQLPPLTPMKVIEYALACLTHLIADDLPFCGLFFKPTSIGHLTLIKSIFSFYLPTSLSITELALRFLKEVLVFRQDKFTELLYSQQFPGLIVEMANHYGPYSMKIAELSVEVISLMMVISNKELIRQSVFVSNHSLLHLIIDDLHKQELVNCLLSYHSVNILHALISCKAKDYLVKNSSIYYALSENDYGLNIVRFINEIFREHYHQAAAPFRGRRKERDIKGVRRKEEVKGPQAITNIKPLRSRRGGGGDPAEDETTLFDDNLSVATGKTTRVGARSVQLGGITNNLSIAGGGPSQVGSGGASRYTVHDDDEDDHHYDLITMGIDLMYLFCTSPDGSFDREIWKIIAAQGFIETLFLILSEYYCYDDAGDVILKILRCFLEMMKEKELLFHQVKKGFTILLLNSLLKYHASYSYPILQFVTDLLIQIYPTRSSDLLNQPDQITAEILMELLAVFEENYQQILQARNLFALSEDHGDLDAGSPGYLLADEEQGAEEESPLERWKQREGLSSPTKRSPPASPAVSSPSLSPAQRNRKGLSRQKSSNFSTPLPAPPIEKKVEGSSDPAMKYQAAPENGRPAKFDPYAEEKDDNYLSALLCLDCLVMVSSFPINHIIFLPFQQQPQPTASSTVLASTSGSVYGNNTKGGSHSGFHLVLIDYMTKKIAFSLTSASSAPSSDFHLFSLQGGEQQHLLGFYPKLNLRYTDYYLKTLDILKNFLTVSNHQKKFMKEGMLKLVFIPLLEYYSLRSSDLADRLLQCLVLLSTQFKMLLGQHRICEYIVHILVFYNNVFEEEVLEEEVVVEEISKDRAGEDEGEEEGYQYKGMNEWKSYEEKKKRRKQKEMKIIRKKKILLFHNEIASHVSALIVNMVINAPENKRRFLAISRISIFEDQIVIEDFQLIAYLQLLIKHKNIANATKLDIKEAINVLKFDC